MILTNRDKSILAFVERYGSITINQCSKIFFSNCKQSYYQSRKRLKLLSDNSYLKRYRQDMRSEAVYYIIKRLSLHDLKVLDVYAYIKSIGAEIKTFEREYIIPCDNKEYRSDGLIECIYDGYFIPILIEIDYTHFTGTKKLMDIYKSEYFQNKYKEMDFDLFPLILIARPVRLDINVSDLPFNVIYIDMDMNNINKIFD